MYNQCLKTQGSIAPFEQIFLQDLIKTFVELVPDEVRGTGKSRGRVMRLEKLTGTS